MEIIVTMGLLFFHLVFFLNFVHFKVYFHLKDFDSDTNSGCFDASGKVMLLKSVEHKVV